MSDLVTKANLLDAEQNTGVSLTESLAHHLRSIDAGVETNPTLAGTAGKAVLHPPTVVDLDSPIVATQRH